MGRGNQAAQEAEKLLRARPLLVDLARHVRNVYCVMARERLLLLDRVLVLPILLHRGIVDGHHATARLSRCKHGDRRR